MSAGSLEKPEQFVVVDDHTFRVDFIRKDKMLMFNLAVVVPFVINSALARKNTGPATSSGVPKRLSGVRARIGPLRAGSSCSACVSGVAIQPGATALTRMPSSA